MIKIEIISTFINRECRVSEGQDAHNTKVLYFSKNHNIIDIIESQSISCSNATNRSDIFCMNIRTIITYSEK